MNQKLVATIVEVLTRAGFRRSVDNSHGFDIVKGQIRPDANRDPRTKLVMGTGIFPMGMESPAMRKVEARSYIRALREAGVDVELVVREDEHEDRKYPMIYAFIPDATTNQSAA